MKYVIAILLFLLTLNSMAQSEDNLKNLLDKKWKLKVYEIEGQKFPAENSGKDDYTIFYTDHSAKSIDRGVILLSKWKFDPSKNVLTLYSDSRKESSEMKICNLSETEFVFQTTNPEGMTMTIHMTHSTEK